MMQDLSLSILDVAQNSVAAGASFLSVTVDEQPARDLLRVVIADDGRGMTPEEARRAADPFYTTRTTRTVGLGLPFFKMAADLSGGGLTIDSAPGAGTTVTAEFGLTNIDRPPLGDVDETVAVLIQGSPDMDVLYVRRLGDRQMSLDTRVLRRALGDIPLDAPGVSRFIGEYLARHTRELLAIDN